MIFDITHVTEFSYSRPVFVEPHTVRLRPRCDGWQRLLDFEMQIEPEPAGLAECIDIGGTSVTRLWFDGTHESLSITTNSTVETLLHNPYDFVLDPESVELPVEFDEDIAAALGPYRDSPSVTDEISAFSTAISAQAGKQTLSFLDSLTRHIHESLERFVRPEGDPWRASVTLAKGKGACRDLAVLEMDAVRAAGLPARFVSSYRVGDPEDIDRELHAWVEVYLPGVGWRGYDPTTGLAVADGHVALSAGASPRTAAPTSGTFRGTGAGSSIHTSISMNITGRS